ncbi:MAG: hypothetical protein ACJAVI_005489 [Candidatus Azotimanducaceae bacterium]|jgi:hypothetical protein
MVNLEMNIQKFRKLLGAYGTNSEVWPSADKETALRFLDVDPEAKSVVAEFRRLDEILNADVVTESSTLKMNILKQIQSSNITGSDSTSSDTDTDLIARIWNWLAPQSNGALVIWRPAMVACIPLLAGIYLGTMMDTSNDENLLEWEEDIYVMGLVSENTEEE